MKIFRKKWVSSMLTVALVFTMIVGGIPGLVYAQQDGNLDQTTEADIEGSSETATIVAPNQLSLDGSKRYAILTKCAGGNHTYGLGSEATATTELGISGGTLSSGNAVSLPQEGLGWSIRETDDGLIISNIFARGGTLFDSLR